jgi:hypothetical protein
MNKLFLIIFLFATLFDMSVYSQEQDEKRQSDGTFAAVGGQGKT